jgi:ankyrin repeat protein
LSVVQLLLDAGVSVDLLDAQGMTPLQRAVSGGFSKIVSLLVEKGANVNTADADLSTPLHKALFRVAFRRIAFLRMGNTTNQVPSRLRF